MYWVPGLLTPGGLIGLVMNMTTHIHLVPK
jgi:hypothetical protein